MRIDLDTIDFKALARAYKIIYFYSVGRSKVLELFFDETESEELENWEKREVSPELEVRFKSWLQENMHKVEIDIALRMVFEEIAKKTGENNIIS